MEIDHNALSEVLERLIAAREAGLPVSRFKWGDMELEIAAAPTETSTPLVLGRTTVNPVDDDTNGYKSLFKGQLPSFRSE